MRTAASATPEDRIRNIRAFAAARSAGIDALLDTIISVEEVKIFKVSPRVYNLGTERMNVAGAELGFAADRVVAALTNLAPLVGG